VKTLQTIDPTQFVSAVRPLIESNDARLLIAAVSDRWSPSQIAGLLDSNSADARKVAALCLGLVGRKSALEPLRHALGDADPCVQTMAEHAMWSIWFRAGSPEANSELARGAVALEQRKFECAHKHFARSIELDPTFAEPFNQRAILHYLNERYPDCIADCRLAIERMPCHFGAWAGMGHCHAHLGDIRQAIDCYTQALQIHPGLDGIHQALRELRCS
jgi:tetratricopeptide (TPR) repeat protein